METIERVRVLKDQLLNLVGEVDQLERQMYMKKRKQKGEL